MGIATNFGLGLTGGTIVIIIISISLPNWVMDDKSHSGLWRNCDDSIGPSICQGMSNAPEFLKATQAMELLGLLCLIASLSCVLARVLCAQEKETLSVLGGIAGIVAGVFMLLGGIVYGGTFTSLNGDPDDLNMGFALAFLAGALSIVAGIIFIVGRRH